MTAFTVEETIAWVAATVEWSACRICGACAHADLTLLADPDETIGLIMIDGLIDKNRLDQW